ncbi:MAG: 23S rRNA (guanosine(2251)-2'-O)-methyltransferase RlmB [Alphaproteobacteria bacterium]|nr:23S rRNA (guanosine(2251)-2'-O)-methyltransferase RlmB [Alphaproteobacteria bacterium]
MMKSSNKSFKTIKSSRHRDGDGELNWLWVGGKNPCFLILKNHQRQIFEILITENNREAFNNFIKKNSLEHFFKITKIVDNNFLNQTLSRDFVHQGIAIKVSKINLKTQFELLEELNHIDNKNDLPNILILDQITDPQNVGAIIRSAVAFDFNKIIFCAHNCAKESSSMIKASAGNIEFAELFVASNLNNLLDKLKKIGYWCVGLAGEGSMNEKKIAEYKNIALVVGSEGDGIRSLVKKNCDILVRINTNIAVESLNVSVATAIALNEIYKSKNV